MRKLNLLLIGLIALGGTLFAQPVAAPSCPTQSIYAHNGSIINGHTLPNGPATTVLNNLPAGAGGLAIGPAFGFPAPNPTWWTTVGGTYWYYNNAGGWTNTNHSTGNGAAVNIGGGGSRLYNLVGATGQIYVYNGTGNGTLLNTIVPAFGGAGPYDVVCDYADNFFILRGSNPQGIFCYNPQGVLTCSWAVTGMLQQTAGGGFAILTTPSPTVHRMYYNSNGTDYIGDIFPGINTIASTVQALPGGGDYACCALPIPTAIVNAPNGGTLSCGVTQVTLVAQVNGNGSLGWNGGYGTPTTTPISPTCGAIQWSGPGILTGQGTPTIVVNQPGVYTFTLTGCNGCPGYTTTASYTVAGAGGIVVPIITAPACFTGPSTMSVSPNNMTNTVLWTGPGIVGPNNTFTINFNQPGTYTAVVSSGTNCSGSATVFVSPSPTITALSNPTIICNGGSATLTAGGAGAGGTYTWNPGSPGMTMAVSPSVTTIYTVNGTSSVGCTGSATVQLNVGVTPTITAVPNPSSLCFGGSSTVTLNGAVNYTTTPGNLIGNTYVLTPSITTNYSVLGTSVDGCTNTANYQIVVNPLPTVTASGTNICAGQSINLNSGGATTYAWSGPLGFATNQQNPVIVNAQPNMTGQYTVVGTTAAGCTGTAVANVSVTPVPAPTITANTPCVGGTLNLTGIGGTTYTWTGPNGFLSLNQNPSINNVNLSHGGVYTLSVSIGLCTSFASYTAIVNPLPAPTFTNTGPVCEKNSITITGPGGLSYQWFGPNNFTANGNNITLANVNVNQIGTYTALATDQNGCVGAGTTFVNVFPLPLIGTQGSTLCANKTVTIWASGGTQYSWTGPNGFTANTGTVFIPTASLSMMGEYTVEVTDANGCKNLGATHVSVNPMPTVTAGYNGPICIGQNIQLTASAANAVLYYWRGPQDFLTVLQNPPVHNLSLQSAGVYTVFVHDQLGCEGQGYVNVVVRPQPVTNISSDKLSSCVPLCINTSYKSDNEIVSNKWYFNGWDIVNGNTASYCFKNPGHHIIRNEYVDNFGCRNTSTFAVDAWPIPVADFNFKPSEPVVHQDVVFTDATREATITSWSWYFSHAKDQVIMKPEHNMVFTDAGSYVAALIVVSDHGCKDTVVKPIVVGEEFAIYVPDAFSPNGDGVNDMFFAKGVGITKFQMMIFDRWGEKLFTSDNIEQGWDGKYHGRGEKDVKQDVYVWKINVTDNHGKSKELKGHVTLIK